MSFTPLSCRIAPILFATLLLIILSSGNIDAQIPLDGSYEEHFNSIGDAKTANAYPWMDNSTIPGWYATVNDKPANLYRVTKGSTASITPPIWLVRMNPNEAALGSIAGNKGTTPYTSAFGIAFTNKTGKTISAAEISYHGEQWAFGPGGADKLTFEYSVDATSLTTGTWTADTKLDFNAPHTGNATFAGMDGNNAANAADLKSTISGLSIPPEGMLWLRWSHAVVDGGNQGLAVDDLAISPQTK